MERLGLIMTLHDVGFSNEEAAYYMQLEREGSSAEEKKEGVFYGGERVAARRWW